MRIRALGQHGNPEFSLNMAWFGVAVVQRDGQTVRRVELQYSGVVGEQIQARVIVQVRLHPAWHACTHAQTYMY